MREMVEKGSKEVLIQIFFKDKHIWKVSWVFHIVLPVCLPLPLTPELEWQIPSVSLPKSDPSWELSNHLFPFLGASGWLGSMHRLHHFYAWEAERFQVSKALHGLHSAFDSSLDDKMIYIWEDANVTSFFFFLGPHPQHMEFPRLGVKLELQLLAYSTATAMQDPSRVCDLHHHSWQRWIPDPLSKAKDWTCILMDTSQIPFHCATTGTPYCDY